MTQPPPDTPGWVWVVGLVLVAVCTYVIPEWIKSRRERREERAVLFGLQEQITNDHGSNLRDDIDSLRDAIKAQQDDLLLTRSAQERNTKFLRDLDETAKSLLHSQDRRDRMHARDMLAVREDLHEVRKLAEGTSEHVSGLTETVDTVTKAVGNHFLATPEVQEITIRRGIQIAKEELHLGDPPPPDDEPTDG